MAQQNVKRRHGLARIGREVETVGVDPIPDSQRVTSSSKLLIVWVMTSASATTPLIGALLFTDGLWLMVAAIALSWLIYVIPVGLFSEMGRELPLTGLLVARRNFGWHATFLLSLLFTFVNMAWFGLNTATGAEVLAALAHTGVGEWYWIVGGVDIILVVFGFKWLEYFYRYTAVLLVACYAALIAYLALNFSLHLPLQTGPMHWGVAIDTIAGFSILAWMYKTSTLSRFARPRDKSKHKTWYTMVPGVGIMIPVMLMGVMGMYSQQAIGNWNIAVLGARISGWGFAAAIGAALGVMHTNAMNLYPSTVDLLVSLNTVRKPTKWDQPIATIILGVLGTVLAQIGILSHAQTFITDVGDLLGPFAFVMVVDWLWGLRDRDNAASYFQPPTQFVERWHIPPIVCFALGFAFAFWGHDFLPAWFVSDVPLSLVSSFGAGALYGLWLWIRHDTPPAPADRPLEVVSAQ